MIFMIKPDWNQFKAKFSDNPQDHFEWLCYLLFCREFSKNIGVFRYKNQSGIETNPVSVGTEVVGWQAKFYESSLSVHRDEIITTITTSKTRHPELTKILFFTNQEWGQGRGDNDPQSKTKAEEKAKELHVDIEWRTASYFESPFVTTDNQIIAQYFFTLNKSIVALLKERQSHTDNVLSEIQTSIEFQGNQITIDRNDVLDKIQAGLNQPQVIILSGVAGVGKTAVVKDLYRQIKNQVPFYVFKSSEFNANSVNDLMRDSNLLDFIEAHKEEQIKVVVIDSAEQLLDLRNTDPLKEFLSVLIQNSWTVIFTARSSYLSDLDNQFIDNFRITPAKFYLENLRIEYLQKLAQDHHFILPADSKLLDLITNPFYLNEYLRFYEEGDKTDYLSFKHNLWNKLIRKSKPHRERCFLQIASQRANEGQFFVIPADNIHLYDELVQDGILGYETPGYFITHDIYEEWALEKIIEAEFIKRANANSFFERIGNSLPMRRAYRSWVSEKLLLKDHEIERFIGQVIDDNVIGRYWKDESLISTLLSDYSGAFFETFENKLLENSQDLLKRIIFLVRLACKEVDTDLFRQLGIKHPISSTKFLLTKPKGSGWDHLIAFLHKNLDSIGVENSHFMLPVIHDWNVKSKHGETTRLCSLMALRYYQWITKSRIYFSRDTDAKERLFQTILYGASEIADELSVMFHEIIANNWKYHGEPYRELAQSILTTLGINIEVINVLPKDVIALANLFWIRTPKEDDVYTYSGMGVERYYSLEEEHLEYFPSSAYQTPVYWLLKASLKDTIEFILDFTNRTTTSYAESNLDKREVEEIELLIDGHSNIRQYVSNRLWNTYRGTQVSPHVLESMHMALEKYFLEIGKNAKEEVLEGWLLYLLTNSRSASITAIVVSIVLAYPDKTFGVAAMLFKTRKLFLYDTSRMVLDQTARNNYSFGYGLDYHKKVFEDERIASCDDKHRRCSLEQLVLNHQFFKSEAISDDEAAKRQRIIWDILDTHYKALPDRSEERGSDKTWRLFLARMDRRKMKPTTEVEDGQVLISLNPEIDPELKEWSDASLRDSTEPIRYAHLKLWASLRIKNDDKYKQYPQYDHDPHLALKETKEIVDNLKRTQDQTFYLFNHSTPAETCSVLLRDFLDALSQQERAFCKDIVLEAASSSLRPNYQYQIADGVESAISVLPNLLIDFPSDNSAIKTTLLITLFNPHSTGMSRQYSDYSAEAIRNLWKTGFEDAQSLLWGYLLLKPKYETLREQLLQQNHTKGIYQLHEDDLIKEFLKQNEPDLLRMVENKISLDDLRDIEQLDLGILETTFQLIPLGSSNKEHKFLAKSIISAMAKQLLSNSREDKLDYRVSHGFLRQLSYYLLSSSELDIPYYLEPFLKDFNASEPIAELFEEFILAEDRLNSYNNFWTIWNLFHQKVTELYKAGGGYWFADQIARSYLFAQTAWNETATEWHTLRDSNRGFFDEIVKQIGHCPSVLYSITKLLNGVGSIYLDVGMTWTSSMLSNNRNLWTSELERNTIYQLEHLAKKYVYNNRETIRKTKKTKEEILVILDFLIEKGSVVGYLLRENVL